MADIEARLRSLLKVNAAVVGHLHVRSVLAHLTASAMELTGARTARVRIVDECGHTVDAIGPSDPDATETDPSTSAVIAIEVRGEPFAELIVADHPRGRFTDDDVDLLHSLASTASIALDKALTYEATRQRERWAQATADVRAAAADAHPDDRDPVDVLIDALPALTTALVAARAVVSDDAVAIAGAPLDADARTLERSLRRGRVEQFDATGTTVAGFALGPVLVIPVRVDDSGSVPPMSAIVLGRAVGAAPIPREDVERLVGLVSEAARASLEAGEGAAVIPSEVDDLSPREFDVLLLIADGLTNRQIGQRLFLSEKTVKNHVTALLRKLGMARRTQAAVYGSQLRDSA